MGDGLFFIIGIICFFILWVVSGGPTKPISFTGPFITPITNVGQTQNAYGPQVALGGTISAGGASVSVGSGKVKNSSSYAGHVYLNHVVNGTDASNPSQEYLTIQTSPSATVPINISGWRILSTATGVTAVIPEGAPLLRLGTVTLQPILLQPNSIATITTGLSPVNVSYQENVCTNLLQNPQTYMNCFAIHVNNPNFTTNAWRIYLNSNVRLWKNSGDTIELLDATGKVVDNFSY